MSRGKRRRPTTNLPQPSADSELRGVERQEEFFPEQVEYSRTTFFSGPLPTPEMFFQYDQILPGAADRILGLTEREMEHRQQMEQGFLRIHSRNSLLGIFSGALIGLSAVLGGVYIAAVGGNIEGAGVALGGLTALVGVFVYGKKADTASEPEPEKPRKKR